MKKITEPVRRLAKQAIYDVTPQAIFWRDIHCFALHPANEEDDLDIYMVASFTIGNAISFDIRHYEGHPQATSTVYLPSETVAPDEIEEALERVIECLHVPQTGVAWRRGEDYEYGRLPRQPEDRLREAEARILALKIAAECDGNTASTEYIKKRVPELIPLTEKDLQKSSSRPRENLWQQIVGNVISHKPGNRSIFNQGYAERTFDGLRVTIQGMNYLKSMGFLAS